MKNPRNIRTRVGILISTLAIMALASIPLLGMAQDATPEAESFDQWLLQEGEQIYTNVCIACHQPDGMGIEGIYLPLNGNPLVAGEDPTYLITTVLAGRGGMPAFSTLYTDEEVAAITTYVRQAWDNDAGPVDVLQVADIRKELLTPVEEDSGTQSDETEGEEMGTPEGTPGASPAAAPVATP